MEMIVGFRHETDGHARLTAHLHARSVVGCNQCQAAHLYFT